MREMIALNEVGIDVNNDDFVIVAEFPQIDYALVYRGTRCQPWVAAWCLQKKHKCWSQGHYFDTINDAMKYIQNKLDKIPYDRMNEIASKAIDVLSENELIDDLDYEVDLTEYEREYFGLNEENEED